MNENKTNLTSIQKLRDEIKRKYDKRITDIFVESTFVGTVDIKYFLIQHGTKMFLCNCQKLLGEYFYQKVLFDFQNLNLITFKENSLPINDLLDLLPLTAEKNRCETGAVAKLYDFADMLFDYFSIEINCESGCLKAIPQLLGMFLSNNYN